MYTEFIKKRHKTSNKSIDKNQKDVGRAVVNKVHIQVWIPLQLASYIVTVTHNHSYKSNHKPASLRYLLELLVLCTNGYV